MKRYLSLLIGLLLPLLAGAQTGGYDPANPPNPEWPDPAAKRYTLTLEAIPAGTGSFNRLNEEGYTEGASVNVYAYDHNGCTFQEWKDAEGNTLSTKSSFTFTMPAHNTTLYAIYTYGPDSPDNPVHIGSYMLSLVCKPEGAGSFNFTDKKVDEGTTQSLYAYYNNGFKFLYWEDEDGNVLGTDQRLSYLMPSHASTLTAVYEYAPEVPQNPGANSWDASSGEVVMDCFTAGSLTSALTSLVGNANRDAVTRLTVDGEIADNDFSFANYFTHCTYIDLSRVAGVTTIPSYTWDGNTNLQEIEIPACISAIGGYAFRGCTALRAFNCYATVPPALGPDVFEGVPTDMVVYVPESSVELYQAAEGWKNFTIEPLRSKICTLEVNLPDVCSDGRYKNMQLELVNVKSGQKLRYVVTDRLKYTFNNLVRRSKYQAYLKNLMGGILAETGVLEINEENESVTFTDMKLPRTLTLHVTDGTSDFTDEVSVVWKDAKGTYLKEGKELESQIAGTEVRFAISLPQELAIQYYLPDEQTYTVQEGDNDVQFSLTRISQYNLQGRVLSSTTALPVPNATVTVSQTLNGKYSDVSIGKTDNKGNYSIVIYKAPSSVAFSADDYVTGIQELAESDFPSLSTMVLPDVSLSPISGAVINVSFTYQESILEEDAVTVLPYYPDYNNVEYTLYNKTRHVEITKFSAQFPQIVLLEEAGIGDEIEVTCKSRTAKFGDTKATGVVDDNGRLSLTFNLLELGRIRARFLITDNTAVEGILYDSKGNLVQHGAYEVLTTGGTSNGENTIEFADLPDGAYTLVTMGSSAFFNTLFSVADLASAGLTEDVDYVRNDVTVESGNITPLRNVVIPFFDESKFYYTGSNTAFTVNRANVVQGNYLTLTARVDFLDAYKDRVSDVELLFQLPENSQLVEGSVLLDKLATAYEYRDNTVTVALGENFTDRVRFCIVPSERGNYTPTASVRFQLDGKTIVQPIGSAVYTVTDLTIWVPALISTPTLHVDGNVAAQSQVTVYDGTKVIGTTKALSDGYWSIETELKNPYNLSMHEISAEVKMPSGLTMLTEMRPVEYNERSIQAKTVEMTFYNGHNGVNRTIWVEFDLEHTRTSSPSYMFDPGTEFVFTANLTNNDPQVVHSCIIRVFTNNHEWIELPAHYIPNLDRWVANRKFDLNTMPIGVRVAVDADISEEIDQKEIEEYHEQLEYIEEEVLQYREDMDTYSLVDYDIPEEPLSEPLPEDFTLESADDVIAEVMDVSAEDLVAEIDLAEDYSPYEEYVVTFEGSDEEEYEFFWESADNVDYEEYDADTITIATTEDGGTITVYVADDDSFVVVEASDGDMADASDMVWGIKYLSELGPEGVRRRQQTPRRSRIATDLVTELKARIQVLETAAHYVNQYIEATAAPIRQQLAEIEFALSDIESIIQSLNSYKEKYPAEADAVNAKIDKAAQQIAKLKYNRYKLAKAQEEVTSYISIVRDLNWLTAYAHYGIEDVNAWQAFIDRILPCNGLDDAQARAMSWIAEKMKQQHGWQYITACDMASLAASLLTSGAGKKEGTQLLSIARGALSEYLVGFATNVYLANKAASRNHIRKLKRDRNQYDCAYAELETIDDQWDFSLPYPVVEPIIDPSGYVYEGVSSNRLEGVTATAYYKNRYEDMYGDVQEEIVMWDAANYGQENPLYTDEQGMYQWDVPQGLWQVKFEKEGYQTAYSEWLPVPPPQLDVNIAMTQLAQPEVQKARAFESGTTTAAGVEITFSKYMKPETLSAENIFVKGVKDGEETLLDDLQFACPDLEASVEGSDETFARKVFVTTGNLQQYDEVYVIVNRMVESYAGIQMAETYQQRIDIERQITAISADSTLSIGYGDTGTLRIAALPTEAAAGKQVSVTTASTLVATLGSEAEESVVLTLDADGQALLTVNGALYGTTALHLQVVGEDVVGKTLVSVVDPALLQEVKAPVASRLSGTAVYRGQTVALSCETEGATIYYTTDGSCPCESATRQLYQGPIAINEPMTLKAMSVGYNGSESEVREFSYLIRQSNVVLSLAEGWNWASHDQARPVEKSSLSDVATEVRTQNETDDISAITAMKLYAAQAATRTFTGDQYNPTVQSISLNEGWNWLGYPLDQVLTLDDALSYLSVEDGDIIANLEDGFSEYTEGDWVGTLQTMRPGQGYLYKAVSGKDFVYNTVPTTNARALRGAARKTAAWGSDRHAYPDMMCITARLYVTGEPSEGADYVVGVFADGQCRGVSSNVDGLLRIPVYGDKEDSLQFVVLNTQTGEEILCEQTLVFEADALGSTQFPFVLYLGKDLTDIVALDANHLTTGDLYTLTGLKVDKNQARRGVYIIRSEENRYGSKVYVK